MCEPKAFMPYRTLEKDGTVSEGFAERRVVDALHGPTGNKEPLIVQPSQACFPGSGEWTTGSPEPDGGTPSSASPTSGDDGCSRITGPECPSTRTYEAWQCHGTNFGPMGSLPQGNGHITGGVPLIFSAEASPAKTSPSQGNAEDSPAPAPASSSSSPGSLSLFDPDGFSSRTYPDCSPRTAVGTSESCLERWPTSGTAWDGGFSTHVSSECRSDEDGCSSSEPALTMILEPPQSVPGRYSLSARAAQGILRRAEKRGRTLPSHLSAALKQVAQTTTTGKADG